MSRKWRQKLHLEPPQGWLNDPNGLCFFKGNYHVYFQYDNESAVGDGEKCWGHYASLDMINWEFKGAVLFPDTPDDRNGVYSGSAVVDEDILHIFYTGNVKEDGDHDYIKSGRGANVIHVTTDDGQHMSRKETLLRNSDYPDFCSCHVRDPKVWNEGRSWYMVLGARTLDDKGCVLYYHSDDLENWEYMNSLSVPDFGYMWECPDEFTIDERRFLSVSPQGLKHSKTMYQNIYQSGYFTVSDGELIGFTEWDYGFDFYAPQTFLSPDYRRIIIGWMGLPDIDYINPTVEYGWQHCLTLPREITADDNGILLQNPIEEINSLRNNEKTIKSGENGDFDLPFDLCGKTERSFTVTLENLVEMKYDNDKKLFTLKFKEMAIGGGRTVRNVVMPKCDDIRIIADMSSLEIYLDGGRYVLSTRFYPIDIKANVKIDGFDAKVWNMSEMEV